MKHKRLNPILGGSAAIIAIVAGIATSGCDALERNPQGFIGENTCSIFNCTTLFFLEGGHGDPELDADADHDESEAK